MKRVVSDKNMRKLLARYPGLDVSRTDHHVRVCHRGTGDFIIISMTSSDWRSLRKVERDLEHLGQAWATYSAPPSVVRLKASKQVEAQE